MDLEKVNLTISENQFDKLRRGHSIQVSANNLKNGKHVLYVNPMLAKKIRSAKRRNKGIRLNLSKHELEVSAVGLKDFLKKAKKWYDKHLKKSVGPALKKGVEKLGDIVIDEAEAILPVAKPVLEKGRKYIPKIAEKVGDITGAYGFQCGCPHCGGMLAGSFKPAGGSVNKKKK